MTTPKDKAKELVDKFIEFTPAESEFEYPYAVKCAIICVSQILVNLKWLEDSINFDKTFKFWSEVKTELKKLEDENK